MFNRKGQSTLEYALVIAIIVAGLLLMQHYVKRSYAGRLRSASDDMGEQFDPSVYTANFPVRQFSRTETVTAETADHDGTVAGIGESYTVHTLDQESERGTAATPGTEAIAGWAEDQTLFE